MPYRTVPFINEEFYHLYNRGLGKQPIFSNTRDYSRFIETMFYYQIQNPKPKFSVYRKSKIFPVDQDRKIVDIISYCLMPNHFHILIKQLQDGGITEYMRKFIHSYNKYRNVKYKMYGPIFQGVFKAVHVENDEQLLHLSRYVHLNPLVSHLVKDLKFYRWSSYNEYIHPLIESKLARDEILHFFNSEKAYESFVLDHANYAESLKLLKHSTIDHDEI